MPIHGRIRLILSALATLTLPLPAVANSLQTCLVDLQKYPPTEVARSYAMQLKSKTLSREAAFWSQFCVGRAWATAGEFKKALPVLQDAVKRAHSTPERIGAQSALGATLRVMNRLSEAQTAHQAALAGARELGDARSEATELSSLAGIARQRKQYDTALRLYTHSMAMQPVEIERALVLNNMAAVHSDKGELLLALEALRQAIAIARKLDDQRNLAPYLLNLGDIHRRLQQWQECSAALDDGIALARENKVRYLEAFGLMAYGLVFRDRNQSAKAKEHLNAALNIFRDSGAAGQVAEVEMLLAQLGG
jgi:tetratricopeptide (TPR) repeat protein